MTRRIVGAYAWRDDLEKIRRIGEQMRVGLMELSRDARTVEASRRYTELVALSSEVSIKALELKDYQER